MLYVVPPTNVYVVGNYIFYYTYAPVAPVIVGVSITVVAYLIYITESVPLSS